MQRGGHNYRYGRAKHIIFPPCLVLTHVDSCWLGELKARHRHFQAAMLILSPKPLLATGMCKICKILRTLSLSVSIFEILHFEKDSDNSGISGTHLKGVSVVSCAPRNDWAAVETGSACLGPHIQLRVARSETSDLNEPTWVAIWTYRDRDETQHQLHCVYCWPTVITQRLENSCAHQVNYTCQVGYCIILYSIKVCKCHSDQPSPIPGTEYSQRISKNGNWLDVNIVHVSNANRTATPRSAKVLALLA